jgi:hypothetical protein
MSQFLERLTYLSRRRESFAARGLSARSSLERLLHRDELDLVLPLRWTDKTTAAPASPPPSEHAPVLPCRLPPSNRNLTNS